MTFERVFWFRRLAGEAIKSDPGDQAKVERFDEIGLVDETSASAIDDQWALRHSAELRQRQHVARVWQQWTVERDHVGGGEHFVEGRVKRPEPRHALVSTEERPHPERFAEFRDPLPDDPFAENAQHRPGEITDWMGEEAELISLLPSSRNHVLTEAGKRAPQREDEGKCVFGYRVDRVTANIAHDDSALGAGIDVKGVVSGCRNGNHLEARQSRETVPADRYLVRDRDVAIRKTLHDFFGSGALVFDPFVCKGWTNRLFERPHGAAVEKHDAGHVSASIVRGLQGLHRIV
jgi:hypothetical protein